MTPLDGRNDRRFFMIEMKWYLYFLFVVIVIFKHFIYFTSKLVNISFFNWNVPIVSGFGALNISHGAVVPVCTRPSFRTVLVMDETRPFHSLRMLGT